MSESKTCNKHATLEVVGKKIWCVQTAISEIISVFLFLKKEPLGQLKIELKICEETLND
jgi:hypothetical protein